MNFMHDNLVAIKKSKKKFINLSFGWNQSGRAEILCPFFILQLSFSFCLTYKEHRIRQNEENGN